MAKIKEFFASMPWWGWLIIGLVVLSLLMPLLSLVFPAVGTVLAAVVKGLVQIFKYLFIGLWYIVKYLFIGLWYIISAPVQLVVWIVRKVRGG